MRTEEVYLRMISNAGDVETAGQPWNFQPMMRSAGDIFG